jgi:hypothetical protein
MVPLDALHLSAGRDVESFAEAFEEEIRKSMHEE